MKGLKICYGMQPNKYKGIKGNLFKLGHTRMRALRSTQDIVHKGREIITALQ